MPSISRSRKISNRRNTIRRKPAKKSRRNMKRSKVNKSKRNNRKRTKRSMRKNMRGGGTDDLRALEFYDQLRKELEKKIEEKLKLDEGEEIGDTLIFTKGAVKNVSYSDIERAIKDSGLTADVVDKSIIIDDGDTENDRMSKKGTDGSFTMIGDGVRAKNVVSMTPMVKSDVLKKYCKIDPNPEKKLLGNKGTPIDGYIFKKHYGLHGACVTLAVNDYFDSDQNYHFKNLVYIESLPEGKGPGDSLKDEISYWHYQGDARGRGDFIHPGLLEKMRQK